ncbi:MAG: transposase [Proteobacteria bacterium]|nr:transposase [Pseudomonadota bacterium]
MILKKNGYTHVTVNHSKDFIDRKSAACTNGIESDWRHAKVTMPRYGVHHGMHAGYLAEFMWRRLHADDDKFLTLINDINNAFVKKYLCGLPISVK